jgi:membrane protease YdiL (CAAX protease family)
VIGAAALAGAWAGFTTRPDHAPTAADLRTVELAGLRLPLRASVAVAVMTLALLFDYSRTFVPDWMVALGRSPDGLLALAVERVVLFGLLPLAVVVLVFRDRPSRYGLTIGDWRWGASLMLAGCMVMTPIVVAFAALPDARAYYAPSGGSIGQLVVANVLDLTAAEFAVRGFLLLTLVRVIGPFGVVVATLPFVFGHLGKPELELFSTLIGGMAYGWLAWRTGSIVWGSIAHVYILTLAIVVAAGT